MSNKNDYKEENEEILKLFQSMLNSNLTNKFSLSKSCEESPSSITQKFKRIALGTCKINTLHKMAEDLGFKLKFSIEKREAK